MARHALDVILQRVRVAKDSEVELLEEETPDQPVRRVESGRVRLVDVAPGKPLDTGEAARKIKLPGDLFEMHHCDAPESSTKKRPGIRGAASFRIRYGMFIESVPPAGLEPALSAPEADALSTELWGQNGQIITSRAKSGKLEH